MTDRLQVLLLVGLTLFSAGCGGKKTTLDVVPVAGTVTLDGTPLADADITASPTGTTAGQGGGGRSSATGEFQLNHFRGEAGLPPGDYSITVSLRKNPDGSVPPPNDPTPPIESQAKETLPARYSDPTATTLKATVIAGGAPLKLELQSGK